MLQIIAMGRTAMSIGQAEMGFFVELGSRITQRRKDSHLTWVQLAETLGRYAAITERLRIGTAARAAVLAQAGSR